MPLEFSSRFGFGFVFVQTYTHTTGLEFYRNLARHGGMWQNADGVRWASEEVAGESAVIAAAEVPVLIREQTPFSIYSSIQSDNLYV